MLIRKSEDSLFLWSREQAKVVHQSTRNITLTLFLFLFLRNIQRNMRGWLGRHDAVFMLKIAFCVFSLCTDAPWGQMIFFPTERKEAFYSVYGNYLFVHLFNWLDKRSLIFCIYPSIYKHSKNWNCLLPFRNVPIHWYFEMKTAISIGFLTWQQRT